MAKEFFKQQESLPKFPVPTLSATFTLFLETVRPYLTEEQIQHVRGLIEKDLNDPRLHGRQKKLQQLSQEQDNWLEKIWMDGYMNWQVALPINSNVAAFLLHPVSWTQSFSAAAVTIGAIQFFVDMTEGKIPTNLVRGKPQCMDQYTRMFGTTRVPGSISDSLVRDEKQSSHIVILVGGRCYSLDVLREKRSGEKVQREIIPLQTLHTIISSLLDEWKQLGDDEEEICVLTATDRPTWANVRQNLLIPNHTNKKALEKVESALFVISLEPNRPQTNTQRDQWAIAGNGRTTWFDKSFQLRFSVQGDPGIIIEHSWADAPVPLAMFFHYALPYAEKMGLTGREKEFDVKEKNLGNWSFYEPIVWQKSDEILVAIHQAQKIITEAIQDSDLELRVCSDLGKDVWRAVKLSPDSACQLAFQLAYRRMTGAKRPVATYETIGLTGYQKGRTECCKVVSVTSENFVNSALTFFANRTDENRKTAEKALRGACAAHLKYISEGQQARGIDRHLLGLRSVLSEEEEKSGAKWQPNLFSHPVFAESGCTGGFLLSTSNNGYISRNDYCGQFGAVLPDGYGIVYIPMRDSIVLAIESKKACPDTNSAIFSAYIDQSLRDILSLAGNSNTSSL